MTVDRLDDLEVRHLLALDAIDRLGTFGRAADELGYTQSAISQQIAALERVVGGTLFDRTRGPRPARLTPYGDLVLAHARALLSRVRAAEADLTSFQAGASGRLRVGTFESVSTSLVPRIVRRMVEDLPDLDLELVGSADDRLVPYLREGRIDLCFMVGENGEPGEFDGIDLLEDHYALVARPDFAPPGPVRIRSLAGVALLGDPTEGRHRIDPALRAVGVEPTYAFRTHENSALLAMVKAGLGVAIMPRLAIDRDDAELVRHELRPPPPPRRVRLTWRAGRSQAPVADRFVAHAVAVATELAAGFAVERR